MVSLAEGSGFRVEEVIPTTSFVSVTVLKPVATASDRLATADE